MNRLPLDMRERVLACLCEGMSIRATVRVTGVAKNTIQKLLHDVGNACWGFQNEVLRDLQCERLQCDEIWSFVHTKDRNMMPGKRGVVGHGSVWTWTGIDPDTKLIVTWHLGQRERMDAQMFVRDLASRVTSERVQITTDGLGSYAAAIERWFYHRADYATEIKDFGYLGDENPDQKYSPMIVKSVKRRTLYGVPDPDHITTSHVERNNLTMRMSMRRFTRLTNAFSKKIENHALALSLHFMYYNFVRVHSTIKTTPAMAAGVADHQWTVRELAILGDMLRVEKAA